MVDSQPGHVVHVLTVEQDNPDVRARLPQYRALLNDDERVREARFYFDADKERDSRQRRSDISPNRPPTKHGEPANRQTGNGSSP